MSSALDRLKNLTNKISSYETTRKENYQILQELYEKLGINEKVETFACFLTNKEFPIRNISDHGFSAESTQTFVKLVIQSFD